MGRTARAAEIGEAFTLVAPEDGEDRPEDGGRERAAQAQAVRQTAGVA